MDLCKYKDIFGKPREGVHSYRIFNIAIVDLGLTIIIGYLISKFFKLKLLYVLIVLFILGIIAHKLFCVKTTINNLIFTDQSQEIE
jgi:hypothetical protein